MARVELRVDAPAAGGACVGRIDGRVTFCRLSLPGETVAADVADNRPDIRFWRAEATEILAGRHPDRVESPCPWFTPGGCGGCAWLHAAPALQLDLKGRVLRETLWRVGGLRSEAGVSAIGAASGWRTRLTLHVDAHGRAGFHAPRSHDVIPVAACLQADPALGLDELLARDWPAGSTVEVAVSEAGRSIRVVVGDDVSAEGPVEHVNTVRGRVFRRAADGFWQSHRDAANVLADLVIGLAEPAHARRIIDLYAGVGLFGLSLADSAPGAKVHLVEGDRTAARYARENAGGDPRITTEATDVRRWARGKRGRSADLIVLDPPRAGAGTEVMRAIAAARPQVVVYVSCDPATLARDLKTIAGLGYCPDHVQGLDLFPGTAHVETVVRLRPCDGVRHSHDTATH